MNEAAVRITNIKLYKIFLPYNQPIIWSGGREIGKRRLVVLTETDQGVTGVGEVAPWQPAIDGFIEQAVLPHVIGASPYEMERIYQTIQRSTYYGSYPRSIALAWCAIEISLWDILGKLAGQPIYNLLGGSMRERVQISAQMSIEKTVDAAVTAAQKRVAQGYRTLKLKAGLDPYMDVQMAQSVRKAVGDSIHLRLDPNQAWTVGTTRKLLHHLVECDLQYLEQPVRGDSQHQLGILRRSSSVPISVNEGAFTPPEFFRVLREDLADVVEVDPCVAGGIWEAKKVCILADAAGIPAVIHATGGSAISTAAEVHLAASTPNHPFAMDTVYEYFDEDIVRERLEIHDGEIQVPTRPGLGVEIDMDSLERHAVDSLNYPAGQGPFPWF
jgi:L-alanine-DL-glutamate epimerase-like enolase superfamily enzyme